MQCKEIDDICVWVHFNMPHLFRSFRYGFYFLVWFILFIASSSFAFCVLCVHMKNIRQELSGADLITRDRVNECNLGNVFFFFYIFVSFDSHLIAMRNSFGFKVELIECCPVVALLYSILFFIRSVIGIIGVYETLCMVDGSLCRLTYAFCPSDDWQSDRSIDSVKFEIPMDVAHSWRMILNKYSMDSTKFWKRVWW